MNVWCGVLGSRLIGSFVFDNLTGNTYEAFLRHELPGLLEDIPLIIRSQMYFQHGAQPHYTRHVREFLNESFPNRWLGRGGPHCMATEIARSYNYGLLPLGPHEDLSLRN